ncbi:MAG TPA: HlyD family secretion protein [Steroidobacteraceae bacterium]|nr:HlyD family secretion protein [Steroidobacteraceae bacterium]
MAEDAPNLTATPVAAPRAAPTKIIKWSIVGFVLIAGIVAAIYYWHQSQLFVSTDNAYVNANRIEMATQVSGPVTRVWVRDQQTVRAGEVLFEIDTQPYQIAVDAAEAQLELAYQGSSQERAAVAAARAQVVQRTAELANARSNEQRSRELTGQKLISKQSAEAVETQARTAEAAVSAAQANLQQALGALGQAGERNAAVRAATAQLARAQLDFSHTRVVALSGGTLANFDIRPGTMVQAGVPVFTIIDDREFWVDANFKETELERVKPGQSATIEVDMYPGHDFRGEVQSLSGGAGQAFSLLPAQNATGNWVKVTQRVPVRVRVLNPDPNYPLRIGTTADVRVAAPD